MKAAVIRRPGDLVVDEVPVPTPERDQLLVKVAASGVCGTDIHIYEGSFKVQFPFTPGHEFCGTVVEVGPEVRNYRAGDRISVVSTCTCGKCIYCRTGREHLCVGSPTVIGINKPGGFAEYVLVPEKIAFRVPDNVPSDIAALTEPLACSIHAVEQGGIRLGDIVAVIGGGAMGLLLVQLARHSGAGLIILSEPDMARRELGKRLGADIAVDPLSQDLEEVVQSATGGLGVDVCIEAVGSQRTAQQAIGLPRRGGTVVLLGVAPDDARITVAPIDMYRRELTIKGSFVSPYTGERAIPMLSKLNLGPIITHRFTLDECAKAIEAARDRISVKSMVCF